MPVEIFFLNRNAGNLKIIQKMLETQGQAGAVERETKLTFQFNNSLSEPSVTFYPEKV